jgi:hypothetical protein
VRFLGQRGDYVNGSDMGGGGSSSSYSNSGAPAAGGHDVQDEDIPF